MGTGLQRSVPPTQVTHTCFDKSTPEYQKTEFLDTCNPYASNNQSDI